ncbi:MAG: hypothetical protein AB7G62_20740 [Magnetospirillum sp.]
MIDQLTGAQFELMTLGEWKSALQERGYSDPEQEMRRAIANGRMFNPDPPGCPEIRLFDRPTHLDWDRVPGWRSSPTELELDIAGSRILAPFRYPLARRTQKYRMEWTAIRIFRSSVDHFWPPLSKPAPTTGAKRGRQPLYDWPSYYAEVRRFLEEHGTVDPTVDPGPSGLTQAKVERHMQLWTKKSWNLKEEISLSTIRRHYVVVRKSLGQL